MLDQLAAKLQKAWQRQHGETLTIHQLKPLSAGASASSYLIDFSIADSRQKAVLQLASGDSQFDVSLNKTEQAATQAQAHAAGIKTPEVLLTVDGQDDLPDGFVSRFVAGETLGGRILKQAELAHARSQLSQHCAEQLAAIHALPTAQFPQLSLRHAQAQLDSLCAIHQALDEPLPGFAAAAAWMRSHLPAATTNCIVHGDFRIGNLLVDESGLAGVLDWELAHLGDPMEDLAWLCLRSWRFGQNHKPVGGFAQREDFYTAYESHSGRTVERESLRFWEVLGAFKWGVICQWFAHRRLNGELIGLEPALIGRRVSEAQIQMLELIYQTQDLSATTSQAAPPAATSTLDYGNRPYRDELFQVLIQWHQAIAKAHQPSAYEARIAANALKILQREAALGPASASHEHAGLQELLGQNESSLLALNSQLCQQLESKQLAWDEPALQRHLVASVTARLAIDNPKF